MSRSQLEEIRTELARESRRFGPDDPRAQACAAALRRIEDGTYGYCAICDRMIPHERLAVMPETMYCISCRVGSA
jgi:RNA polymerase-binding transcription factor DksA